MNRVDGIRFKFEDEGITIVVDATEAFNGDQFEEAAGHTGAISCGSGK